MANEIMNPETQTQPAVRRQPKRNLFQIIGDWWADRTPFEKTAAIVGTVAGIGGIAYGVSKHNGRRDEDDEDDEYDPD